MEVVRTKTARDDFAKLPLVANEDTQSHARGYRVACSRWQPDRADQIHIRDSGSR
jgi:hypothetical protein